MNPTEPVEVDRCDTCEIPVFVRIDGELYDLKPLGHMPE